ncbi:conserved hypothetical protein [Neospora caninum Liverpool]|uniref:MSP domain-containing protein n=1 Tax=Neospora caninum (strain Liverpool) TaxID=572307 RepID=F0VAY5_NEOCL|nr:conserved hypothetical protein [Neospora caninum Liverpool]CBZ51361.1 conserved hypothetical protein [Neospora caninum Liverpool]CEL68680.1 TPA: hypothetical protein BN1204_044250 [Neospora caninum Liverpool]|eukprot:XP_003881394.1 conserved hypothetical protein [Neospora caninum Liverpool]
MEPRIRNSSLTPGELLFEPEPQVIFFVDFAPFKTYECVLRLRNRDSVARRVQVLQPEARAFEILPGKGGIGPASPKVAPGMTTCFTVKFSPDAREDYISELIVVTEREKFVVPLRAISGIGFLDLPPGVAFGPTPVKVKREKTILIRNTGTKAMVFTIHTSRPFSAVSTRCFLGVGDSTQVTFSLEPLRVGWYSSVATLRTTEGLEFSTDLTGQGINADVKLSSVVLKMENTSVALLNEKTVYLHNNSDDHLDFSWSLLPESSESNQGSRAVSPRKSGPCEEKNLLKATSSDPGGTWQDCPIFQIVPAAGRVWANTSLAVTVTFRPVLAARYRGTARCAVAGRETPLLLEVEGTGTGPKAQFLETDMDLGRIVVNTETSTENELVNQGDIGATFSLRKASSPAQNLFTFTPEEGHLAVGETVKIKIRFRAHALGAFEETFDWCINDLPRPLQTTYRGEVLPPALTFDVDAVDFGRLSLGFPETRRVTLKNASCASQPFVLRLEAPKRDPDAEAEETPLDPNEFEISPVTGVLDARGSREISLVLTPSQAKRYAASLVVDLGSLTPHLLSVPVKATCELPTVKFEPDDVLQFGEVFVGHPYTQKILIHNSSTLPARYEVAVQAIEAGQVTLDVEDAAGAIDAFEMRSVSVHLCAKKTGHVAASLKLFVAGANETTWLRLRATACGPRVRAEPRELDWGKVTCLEEAPRFVKVTNACPIAAEVTCSLRGKDGCFRLKCQVLTVAPGSSEMLEVIGAFPEPVQAQELLVLSVADGAEIPVVLRGLGTQTPVVFSRDLSLVDFGMLYTGQLKTFSFTVENRGRRARKLSWLDARRAEKQLHPKEDAFTVWPETVVLEPNASAAFEYRALSQSPGHLSHALVCTELSGFGTKSVPVLKTTAEAHFFVPSVSFSSNAVSFRYVWKEGVSVDHMTQEILCSNETPLAAACAFKAPAPFSVSPSKLRLRGKSTSTLTVSFDPRFNGRVCSKLKEKLDVTYEGHSKTETVELRAEVVYPAVEIDTKEVDFGCIFNETSRRLPITLKNPTELPVVYHWYLTQQYDFRYASGDNDVPLALVNTAPPPPINKVFDFLPFTGSIEPGETETICATFFGVPDVRVTATALCVIENGPEFCLSLRGQASLPTFRVTPSEFDFGEVPYSRVAESELTIHNTGLVDFQFFVDLSKLAFPWLVDVSKKAGKVPSRNKQKVVIRVRPGMPMEFHQTIFLEIGHFESVPIFIRGVGTFPSISLNLPRRDDASHQSRKAEMMQKLSTAEPGESRQGALDGDDAKAARPRRAVLSLEERAEREVDRLNVCENIQSQYLSLLVPSLATENGKKSESRAADSGALPERQASNLSFSTASGEALATKAKTLLEGVRVTAAQYVYDFGNIVVGQNRRKAIRITNRSSAPISLRTNKRAMASLRFSVEPEIIHRLVPGEEATLTVSTASDKEGSVSGVLQLQSAEGTLYTVHLRASFVVPDLTISTDKVDFGTVKRDQRKTVFVRFKNTVAVPVAWRLRDRIDKRKPPESGQAFGVDPTQGTLNPGEFVDVKLFYYAAACEQEATTKLFLQLEDNPKWRSIFLRGRTQVTLLRVSPSGVLEFDSCLPLQPAKREISIANLGSTPCEVCAVDFDEQHQIFEQALRDYPDFDASGVAFLPVRKPGKPFWRRVLRRALHHEPASGLLQTEATEVAAEDADSSLHETEKREDPEPSGLAGVPDAVHVAMASHGNVNSTAPQTKPFGASSHGASPHSLSPGLGLATLQRLPTEATLCEILEPDNLPWSESESEKEEETFPYRVPTEKRVNALVLGPAGVGKSSVAQFLAKTSRRKCLTVDACLDWLVAEERQKFRKLRDDEAFCALAAKVRKAMASRDAEPEQLPKKGNKARKIEARTHPETRASVPAELLVSCLRYRTAMPDCFAGTVFDGCLSSLVNAEPTVLAQCIAEALEPEQLVVMSIRFGEPDDVEDAAGPPETLNEATVACGVQFYKNLSSALQAQEKRLQDQWDAHAAEGPGRCVDAGRRRPGQAAESGATPDSHDAPSCSSWGVPETGAAPAGVKERGNGAAGNAPFSEVDVDDLRRELASVQTLRQKLEAVAPAKAAQLFVAEQIALAEKVEKAVLAPASFSHFVLTEQASRDSALENEAAQSFLPSSPVAQATSEAQVRSSDKHSFSRPRPSPPPPSSSASSSAPSSSSSCSSSSSPVGMNVPRGGAGRRYPPASSPARPREGSGAVAPSLANPSASTASAPLASAPTSQRSLVSLFVNSLTSLADLQAEAQRNLLAPAIPAEPPIPAPEVHEIARRPQPASGASGAVWPVLAGGSATSPSAPHKRTPPVHFSLFVPAASGADESAGVPGQAVSASPEDETRGQKVAAKKAKDAAYPRRTRGEKMEDESASAKSLGSEPGYVRATRWILAPQEEQKVLVKFCVDQTGVYESSLAFSVVGDSHALTHVGLRATCSLPKLSANPNHLFREVLRSRPTDKSSLAKKQFIVSEGVYDFGPLLLGHQFSSARALYAKLGDGEGVEAVKVPGDLQKYQDSITLCNVSPFETTVRCTLQSSGTVPETGSVGGFPGDQTSRKKGPNKAASVRENPFLVYPSEVCLGSNGSREVHVWCFPKTEGEVRDVLVFWIKDNPIPVEIPLVARGAVPRVLVDTDHIQFGRVLVGQTVNNRLVPGLCFSPPHALCLFSSVRLTPCVWRAVTLKNVSPLPARWTVLNLDSLQKLLKVGPETEGTLEAFGECQLFISFSPAQKSANLQTRVSIRIADVEGMGIAQETKTLAVDADAYFIDVATDFGGKGKVVDIGNVRVGETAELPLSITNKGKFPVKYAFRVKSKAVRGVLAFHGPTEELKPAEHRRLSLRCTPQREMNLCEAEEIFLDLQDAESGTFLEPPLPPFLLSLHADFNYVCLVPARGINFGPTESGKTHSLQFEIRNDGRFPFDWLLHDSDQLSSLSSPSPESAAKALTDAESPTAPVSSKETRANKAGERGERGGASAGGGAKPGTAGKAKSAQGNRGQINAFGQFGAFRIAPVKGQLDPGSKVTVEAQYNAQGDANHSLKLALLPHDGASGSGRSRTCVQVQGAKVERGDEIVISSLGSLGSVGVDGSEAAAVDAKNEKGSRETASPSGTPIPAAEYIVQAQSCVPAIITDPDWVFEEQFLVSNAEEAAVWVGLRRTPMYLLEEKCLYFGTVIPSGETNKAGVQERLRIGNPKSVPATVSFELKLAKETDKSSVASDLETVFEVQPKHVSLGPHETKTVTLSFHPNAIQRYCATFKAFVNRAGADGTHAALSFDVKGEGTLPTVSLEVAPPIGIAPSEPASGHPGATPSASASVPGEKSFVPSIAMGRVAVGTTATAVCVLKNYGTIAATARCECAASESIVVELPPAVTLAPNETKTFAVHLVAKTPGEVDAAFRIYTVSNPYEDVVCRVRGTCHIEECRWTTSPLLASAICLPSGLQTSSGPSSPTSGVGGSAAAAAGAGGSSSGAEAVSPDVTLSTRKPQRGAESASAVDFGDVALDETARKSLFLENKTDSFMKFEIASPLPPDVRKVLQLSPTTGILPPRGAQEVTAIFASKESVGVSSVPVSCRAWRLKEIDPTAAPTSSKAKPRAKSSASDPERIEEIDGRFYQMESGKDVELPLFISVRCDSRQCELECRDIVFEDTMLFKSRKVVFTLTNPAKVTLPFEFHWEDMDRLLDSPSFYVLSPQRGVVPPASKNVVEITSVGIGVKNTKRFFVLNPTSSDLEFEWHRLPVPSDSAPRLPKAEARGVLAAAGPDRGQIAPSGASPSGRATSLKGLPAQFEGIRCVNLRGRIAAGKRTEVVVEFLPFHPDTRESFWKFSLPSKKLEKQFLFVGLVKEPHVALDRSSVCFSPVLLGGKVDEVVNIHNREDIPLSFVFARKQLDSERSPLPPCLVVSPANGILPPNSVTPVRLSFTPEDEKPFNCNLLCRVRQKSRALALNVKGAGYSVKHSMILLNEDGSIRELAPGTQTASVLDFGPLLIGQSRRHVLQLQNAGTFDFSFHWTVQSVSGASFSPSLSLSPKNGVVEKGKNFEVILTYAPTEISKHEEHLLQCTISGGDPYRIRAHGSCSSPRVAFSFSSYDFGTFILPPSLPASQDVSPLSIGHHIGGAIIDRVELKITNLDTLHDCFISTPFEQSNVLDVQLVPCSIGPGEKISVPVVFTPKQPKNYKFKIPFSINDRTTAYVTVSGKGILARLEIAPTPDEIRFAPLIKGESAVKHVRIVNRSEASLEFYLPASPNLSSRGISWRPLSSEAKAFSLHPRQELPLEVFFKPAFSIPDFSLPLFAECLVKRGGLEYRFPALLCHVAAKSFETEVRLSQPSLSFGQIVVNSWATQVVKLTNIGELYMHFKFKNSTKFARLVSLSPSEGLLHPHADVPIEVTFRPTDVTEKEVVIDDIACFIKASAPSTGDLSSLLLTVTGQGVAQPMDSVQTLTFSTPVRTQQTKTFQVKNPKKYDWSITPLVSGESPKDAMYFFCSPSGRITIPANQKLTFQITYKPLTMTREAKPETRGDGLGSAEEAAGPKKKDEKEKGEGPFGVCTSGKDVHPKAAGHPHAHLAPFHAASVFVPLPDGEAATCRFVGYATEPTVEQVVDAAVLCRSKHLQLIKIRNWLPVKQNFDVAYTVTQCTGDSLPQIQAPARFDLPPSQARDYRFFALAFKPCTAAIQFRFSSREKADFYLAEARLTFTDPETMGTIALETSVRRLAKSKLAIDNPSTKQAVFQCHSNVPDVFFSPSPLEVLPGATGELEVWLRPNLAGAGEGAVVLTSDELGTYKFLLKYSVAPAEIDTHAAFHAPLGKDVTQTLRFRHYAKKSTTYQATIDSPPEEARTASRSKTSANVENFSLESKSVVAPADLENTGTELPVTVRFTPSRLAEVKATLVLRSSEGFEYKALLVGRGQPPQPQGPFRLGKGKAINIDFKNPFETQTEFSLQVDRPCFSVEKKTLKLEARKATTISVMVKPDAREAGRLIVTADGIPPWIFYLKSD